MLFKRFVPSAPSQGISGRVPQIMQMEALECGAASLAMVCAYYGKWIPLEKVRSDCGVSRNGTTALDIVKAARSYGLSAKGYCWEIEDLRDKCEFPCIVHWCFNHFVVVRGFKGTKVCINDPAKGEMSMSVKEFRKCYTGICLQFSPTEDFVREGGPTSLVSFAAERLSGAGSAVAFAILSAAVSSVLAMGSPIFSQVFVDRVLSDGGSDKTLPFVVLFALFALLRIAISAVSSIHLLRLQGKMAVSSSASYLWKVLHLPMQFFSQRTAGDIAARAMANKNLAANMIGIFAPILVDFVMLVAYLMIMVAYSPLLAAIGVAAVAINVAVARAVSSKRVNITRVQMRDAANLESATMSGISSVETIKSASVEQAFFRRWSGYQASAYSQTADYARMEGGLALVPQLVMTATNCLVLALGIVQVLNGQFTSGMLLAFQGYLSQFFSPAQSLVSSMQALQETRTDAERIEDVMNYPVDEMSAAHGEVETGARSKLSGKIVFENVSFGYAAHGDPILKEFSLKVEPGEMVAIVGASGCGKSTIAKLAAGLFRPWSGTIYVDDVPIENVPKSVRCGSIAVVDQEIVLFSDSISANIRLWDDSIEEYEVILAARDAQIHDAIIERGGYEERLEEGGKDLSGGERQRLEIARALACDPTLLIMDEATSALDSETERRVMQSVKKRDIACIVVAHRLSAIRDCDKIIVLQDGRIVESGTHADLCALNGYYAELVTQE